MDYIIDNEINLSETWRRWEGNMLWIIKELAMLGLNEKDTVEFTAFAVYGFHGPNEKQTLSMKNKCRLTILWPSYKGRNDTPPAWNRTNA